MSHDLGAGVHETPDEPVNGRVGPGVPIHELTCPACGLHDQAERSPHPEYPFLCGDCWTLFTGTDLEWRRMSKHREAVVKRREEPPAPLPPMRSHKSDRVDPIAERVKENESE